MSIKMKRIIAMDCETSGMNWNSGKSQYNESIAHGYQAVSWGFVISSPDDFKPIDKLYLEIKWNGTSKWDNKAESIHGLTKEYLEENGVNEEDAVVTILEFFMEYLDITKPLYFLGQNVTTFDVPFFKDLLYRYNIKDIKIGQRHFDTFALAAGTIMKYDSESIFKKLGMKGRGAHNSLQDAENALETYRRINMAWNKMIQKY